jgi:two-component system, OmpR family, phosphate regulon response regulator PhoB
MKSKTEKLLVVESDDVLRERIAAVLSDAGYQVATDYEEGIKSVLAFGPDVVILGADPPQLDCCDLLSEIKGSEHTQNIRVVMLSPGGSGERTRGMDLWGRRCAVSTFRPTRIAIAGALATTDQARRG